MDHGKSRLVTKPRRGELADRRNGAWFFEDTRMPVATVFENLEAGSDIDEII